MQGLDVTYDQVEAAVARFRPQYGWSACRPAKPRNISSATSGSPGVWKTFVTPSSPPAGPAVLLRQCCQRDFAARVKRGDAGYRGKAAVILSVQEQPGADTVAVTTQIETALQVIQKDASCRCLGDDVQSSGDIYRGVDWQPEAGADRSAVIVALVLMSS